MKTMIDSSRPCRAKLLAILIIAVLVAGVVGCDATHYLTIESTAGGEVTVPGEGKFDYSVGRMVNLVAVADEGHRFVEWTGDVSTIDDMKAATTRIAMDDDYSITANFEEIPTANYFLSISSTTGGSVTTPGEGTFIYDANSVVQLAADALEGYRFVNWTGNVGSLANVNAASTTITMNDDYSINANFEADEPVVFVCANLEAAVRQAIGIAEGGIYPSDMEVLTSLHAWEKGISDLTGLEYATGLTDLALHDNLISDVTPLTGLTRLEQLNLEDNRVSDISPLEGLTNLTVLWLDSNQISDISPLESLTNLTGLSLEENQVSDISPLAGLTDLTALGLASNQIGDISPLEGLTNLWRLRLDDNQISDIKPLGGLTSLIYVEAGSNQISDISALAGLTSLWALRLDNNQISNISPLEGLANMKWLHLDDNQISDISPLAGLTDLNLLYLQDNEISDITPLVDNPGLGEGDEVWLSGNPLGEQSINEHIPALEARGVTVHY